MNHVFICTIEEAVIRDSFKRGHKYLALRLSVDCQPHVGPLWATVPDNAPVEYVERALDALDLWSRPRLDENDATRLAGKKLLATLRLERHPEYAERWVVRWIDKVPG